MSPRLKICERLLQRLPEADLDEDNKACLYGVMYDSALLVVGFTLEPNESENKSTSDLQLNFPTEVDFCGIAKINEDISHENDLRESLQDVDMTDNPLVLLINDKREVKAYFLVHDRFEETLFEIVSDSQLYQQFAHVRLQATLPLTCEATINGVKTALANQRKKISSGQISFHIEKSNLFLFDLASKVVVTGAPADSTLGDLIDLRNPNPGGKKKIQNSSVEIMAVKILMKATRDLHSEKQKTTAVKMVTTQGKPSFSIRMPLILDALVMTHRNKKLVDLYSVLVEAACRSLKLLERNLVEQLDQVGIGDGAGLKLPEPYHFLVPELNHFITIVLPKSLPDDSLVSEREQFHERLNLPKDRPLFRRGNAYPVDKNTDLLISPHEAIPQQPSKPDVVTALVKGRYTYHHYMQDRFDDNGWGCAYRSLQTLCSWMRFQGLTTIPIPTHKDIQECLVDIGDKPSSFIGSKQWIGSTEVSFVLESLLGVQSRIVFSNSGSELNLHAPELVHHFQKHGSPIMIGGGVLAHTILGVEYNTNTQETRYLILDPHYTGAEDISVVIGKGWCGWKNDTFWNKTAHYNLCLPQVKFGV